MTLRSSRTAGFTLIEVLVVLAVVGLVLGIIGLRGPARSPALDLREAADAVSRTLRLARSRAIASNATVGVTFDVGGPALRMDDTRAVALPAGVLLTVTATFDNTAGPRLAAIRFAPDGSSSGGAVALRQNGRRLQVGVDWLSGRVSVSEGG